MRMSEVIYLPQAKWKAGERRAFRTSSAFGHRFVPAFKIPPSGSFDHEEQRVLSTTEYLGRFGHQLAESRGRRLAFVDAELVDDDEHRRAVPVHPLTELLERARLSGALAAPIFSRTSSPDYLNAVTRFVERNDTLPTCFRVGMQELEYLSSASELADAARDVGSLPEKTVLLIDGGPVQVDDPAELARLLAFQLTRVVPPELWLRVFWSATSLPTKPKVKAGEVARFSRDDWAVYQQLLSMSDQLPLVPMFSDYMLEYPTGYAPLRVSPTAKLWYSSSREYILVKGKSTKVESKYKNIFAVAAQLAKLADVKGPDYSYGDEYIRRLSTGLGKTGNASMWKWCSTDHHITMVDDQLTKAFGISRARPQPAEPAEQLQLV